MKNKLVLFLTTLTLMTAAGCDGPVYGNNADTQETDTANESVSDDSTETVEDGGSEGNTDASAQTDASAENSDSAQAESAEQGASDAGTEGAAAEGNSAIEGASFDPEEVVEPEIAEEEITQPVPEEIIQQMTQPVQEGEEDVLDIVFMGDSQFDNARGTGSEIPACTCSLLENVRFHNLAIGGTAASLERGFSPDAASMSDTCFVGLCYALAGKVADTSFIDKYPAGEELKNVDPSKVDLYVIEYGANDYINGKDLWTPENAFDPHSYRGALTVGIDTLRSISPNAKFLLCGPSYCMWYNADGFVIGDSYMVSKGIGTLSEYADICSNYADDEGITYMDTMYATYFDLKITTVDDYLQDGLHYKEKGRQIYSKALAHFIKKTMGINDPELEYMEINTFSFN